MNKSSETIPFASISMAHFECHLMNGMAYIVSIFSSLHTTFNRKHNLSFTYAYA